MTGFLLLACGGSGDAPSSTSRTPSAAPSVPPSAAASPQAAVPVCKNPRDALNQQSSPPPMTIDVARTYLAKLNTARGSVTIKLNPHAAPVTVNNFVCLATSHYYDNLTFHRLEPGFVLQGGDPLGNGTGGPAYKLPNETNPTPWKAGSVGMAASRAGVSGSQFFIVLADGPSAESLARSGVYNQFGTVSEGFDVVGKLQKGDVILSIQITAQ